MKKRKSFAEYPRLSLLIILVFLYSFGYGLANERHFTSTYETATLPKNVKELEFWHTERIGRSDFYHAIDQRLELEWGVTDRLMMAWYLNFTAEQSQAGTPAAYTKANKMFGTSLEAKYKLLDPVADPVGFALYAEVLSKPHEVELEYKLLFDKKIGSLLAALNIVGETEFIFDDPAKSELEQVYEIDLGISKPFGQHGYYGMEVRNKNVSVDGEWERSALLAGPVLGCHAESWWMTMTVMPLLTDFKDHGDRYQENEKVEIRLLTGFHL